MNISGNVVIKKPDFTGVNKSVQTHKASFQGTIGKDTIKFTANEKCTFTTLVSDIDELTRPIATQNPRLTNDIKNARNQIVRQIDDAMAHNGVKPGDDLRKVSMIKRLQIAGEVLQNLAPEGETVPDFSKIPGLQFIPVPSEISFMGWKNPSDRGKMTQFIKDTTEKHGNSSKALMVALALAAAVLILVPDPLPLADEGLITLLTVVAEVMLANKK